MNITTMHLSVAEQHHLNSTQQHHHRQSVHHHPPPSRPPQRQPQPPPKQHHWSTNISNTNNDDDDDADQTTTMNGSNGALLGSHHHQQQQQQIYSVKTWQSTKAIVYSDDGNAKDLNNVDANDTTSLKTNEHISMSWSTAVVSASVTSATSTMATSSSMAPNAAGGGGNLVAMTNFKNCSGNINEVRGNQYGGRGHVQDDVVDVANVDGNGKKKVKLNKQ